MSFSSVEIEEIEKRINWLQSLFIFPLSKKTREEIDKDSSEDRITDFIKDVDDWQGGNRMPTEEIYRRHPKLLTLNRMILEIEHTMKLACPKKHVENLQSAMKSDDTPWRKTLSVLSGRMGKGMLVGLLGPRGVGKTELAVAMARKVVEYEAPRFGSAFGKKETTICYEVLNELFSEIKSTFNSESKRSEDDVLDHARYSKLLILDEVHEAAGTPWQSGILTMLVDGRYRKEMDTILISNDSPAQFIAAVGDSIASRMQECGGIIQCDWPSYRAQPEKKP